MYTDFSDIKEKSKVLIKPSPSCAAHGDISLLQKAALRAA
jgi:hypothetical protein